MKIIFSDHAKERIRERNIPVSRIKKTIKVPDKTNQSFRGRILHNKKFKDKILEVVTVKENSKIIVVTAYYL